MKKVMILFGRSDWDKSRPFENKDYRYSYEFFYDLCKKSGVQIYRASYEWYDYDRHIFKHAWIYEGQVGLWTRVNEIIPDLIYDKTKARLEIYRKKEQIAEHYPFINDLRFTQIIDDKFVTSLLFSKWSKKSWVVRNHSELDAALKQIPGERAVLKPISKSGGDGVQIFKQSEAANLVFEGEHLIQEFIDSSKGVPGVSSAVHDLRLVIVDDAVVYAYIREPKKGSLLANLAQGGSLTIVPKEKLPSSVLPIVAYAYNIFESFSPKIFTIDLMFDREGRPWVVELNSMPGLYFTKAEKPSMERMYAELVTVFKRVLGV